MQSENLPALIRVRAMAASGRAREIRLAARLNLSEVANATGVTATTVYRWEKGERTPTGEPALRYGALLDQLSAATAVAS
jgi:transcriptional regulator with XRE-family HTH domain